MTSTAIQSYTLNNYDSIIIIASWGMPQDYREAKYVFEVEYRDDNKIKRDVIPKHDHSCHYHSSTAAIKHIIKDVIGFKGILDILIFVQDTILFNKLVEDYNERNRYFNFNKVKRVRRKELMENLVRILYSSNRDVAEELEVSEPEEYKKFVVFVPGVMSTKNGIYLYAWRGDRVYDMLRGIIAFYTYKQLNKHMKEHKDVKRIAIILDTTHGINYFVTALKEGVLVGTTLFALERLFEESITNGNNIKTALEELVIYHYNSDPISSSRIGGIPSLKLHLLDKAYIVSKGSVNLASSRYIIENTLSTTGIRQLSGIWKDVNWENIVKAIMLYFRGVMPWALRIISELNVLPSDKEIDEAIGDLELIFDVRKHKYTITYKVEDKVGKTPASPAIESLLLARMLKHVVNKTKYDNSIVVKLLNNIVNELKNMFKDLDEYKYKKHIFEILKKIEYLLRQETKLLCLKIMELKSIVHSLYDTPSRDLVINELEMLRSYLEGLRKPGWNKIFSWNDCTIWSEPRTKKASFIKYKDIKALISITKNIDRRDFYAHAGLSYGLDWFAIAGHGYAILCLGDYKNIHSYIT